MRGLIVVLLTLTLNQHAEAFYTDALARQMFFPLAAAAYSDEPEVCVNKVMNNATVLVKVKVACGDGYVEPEDCFGYVGVSEAEKVIFVGFRGTRGLIQLMYEARRTVFRNQIEMETGGTVSEYFYDVYRKILDAGLGTTLADALDKYPEFEVWVTGHSLGGAMASIAAAELVHYAGVPTSQVRLVTFGQPRTGDKKYSEEHDKIVKHTYRVTHARDMVPHVPPLNFEGYFHHSTEVWYNNNMLPGEEYVKCKQPEDHTCSNQNYLNYSILNHVYYYNVMVSDYGMGGCEEQSKKVM